MERFTANSSGRCAKAHSELCEKYPKCDLCPHMNNAFTRLAYYEDMEEQGRLLVLPCKVGDTLYYAPEWYARCDYGPEPISVEEVNSYSGTIVVECYLDPDTRVSVNTWDFGKTVFLTREEAEKALKGGVE